MVTSRILRPGFGRAARGRMDYPPRQLPGLLCCFDPTRLAGLADGAAVGSFPDYARGANTLAQATGSAKPTYKTGVLNGRPVLRYDGGDSLARAATNGPAYFTLFFVIKPSILGTNRTIMLWGAGTGGRQVRLSTANVLQLNLAGTGVMVQGTTTLGTSRAYVVTVRYGPGGACALRLDGAPEAGATSAQTWVEGALTFGVTSGAQFFSGDMGPVFGVPRALTDAQCRRYEAWLARTYGTPLAPVGLLYVNPATGAATNAGWDSAAPLPTFTAAVAKLGGAGGTIKATAAVNAPLREGIEYNGAGNLTVEAADGATKWYHHGGEQFNSGWSGAGPVYSRTVSGYPGSLFGVWVASMLDGNGFWTPLTANTATPTTPAAGEFGRSGSTLYVRLPGDANPNSHTIEAAKYNYPWLAYGAGTITLRNAYLRVANLKCAASGTSLAGGNIIVEDSVAEYGNSGIGTDANVLSSVVATRVRASACLNDGFNHHGGAGIANLMTLTDCEASYNGDEGVSPHDDTVLALVRLNSHHNWHGGLTAVDRSIVTLTDSIFDANEQDPASNEGGVTFLADASGTLTDVAITNTLHAPGLYLANGALVTRVRVTSGLAAGNAQADVIL